MVLRYEVNLLSGDQMANQTDFFRPSDQPCTAFLSPYAQFFFSQAPPPILSTLYSWDYHFQWQRKDQSISIAAEAASYPPP